MFTAENAAHRLYDAPYSIIDPGDGGIIRCDRQLGICEMVSGTDDETRTLQNPTKADIQIHLRLMTDGGGLIVVYSECGFNRELEKYATFADAGDMLSLISVSITPVTFRWEVFEGQLGATLAA